LEDWRGEEGGVEAIGEFQELEFRDGRWEGEERWGVGACERGESFDVEDVGLFWTLHWISDWGGRRKDWRTSLTWYDYWLAEIIV
jgi:hypothetical protein